MRSAFFFGRLDSHACFVDCVHSLATTLDEFHSLDKFHFSSSGKGAGSVHLEHWRSCLQNSRMSTGFPIGCIFALFIVSVCPPSDGWMFTRMWLVDFFLCFFNGPFFFGFYSLFCSKWNETGQIVACPGLISTHLAVNLNIQQPEYQRL